MDGDAVEQDIAQPARGSVFAYLAGGHTIEVVQQREGHERRAGHELPAHVQSSNAEENDGDADERDGECRHARQVAWRNLLGRNSAGV